MKANNPPLYSTLNPETSSDSPSTKSKGARLVSAKIEINQQKNKFIPKKKKIVNIFTILIILNVLKIHKLDIIIKIILIS